MPRASRVSNPPAAAGAAATNVSSNAGHSDPSCSAPTHQTFRPVTRSMTRVSAAIVAPSDLKEGGSASTSTRKSISDASFSIQSAAFRPTVTRVRTPHKVTTSTWKPLTQPAALSEERKCSTLTTINPTAKRSRVASSRAAKDTTNHSASKANSNVPTGKKNRDEECMSQGDQFDGAVIQSPTKKLQTCKAPSDALPKRISTIRILGGKVPAPLPTGKSQTEVGKNSASVPAKVVSASTSDISQSADAAVPLLAQQIQPDTAKNSSVITESITNEARQVNQLAATVVTLPRQNLKTDYQKMPSVVPVTTNRASGLAGATAPMVLPKLEIGKAKDTSNVQKMPSVVPVMTNQVSGLAGATAPMVLRKLEIGKATDTSNVLSNPAYARALLIKQQEQLLQQYKLGTSQQEQQVHIKGPALPWNDDAPPVEPLGTRCQLCKLDVALRPQGDTGRDASAPPAVAVLACHHAFHSSCIESVYGLAEPSQCLACLEPGIAH